MAKFLGTALVHQLVNVHARGASLNKHLDDRIRHLRALIYLDENFEALCPTMILGY